MPVVRPGPATAMPPVNSAPAMIRFRVVWVLMMRCPFVRRSLAGPPARIVRLAGTENMGHLTQIPSFRERPAEA
jgi:hypothetical protein